jgi:uncharacterized membrane protein YjfL (UPF0719 family)
VDKLYLEPYYNPIFLLNFLAVIGLFAGLRLFAGRISHFNPSDELLTKDNPAFGLSLAGTTLALAVMLSGIIFGRLNNPQASSSGFILVYGFMGMGLMMLTRIIFDRITLPTIHLRDEIASGNKAVAIADVGNVLAVAIIIRAVMAWIAADSKEGILPLLGAYAISQFLMTAMTALRIKVFGRINRGNSLPEELDAGNIALALWFAGRKIGAAFAIAAAAQLVVYEDYDMLPTLSAWFFASLGVVLVWKLLCIVAEKIILFRVDAAKELLEQKNVAIGALQAAIYISLGLLISQI